MALGDVFAKAVRSVRQDEEALVKSSMFMEELWKQNEQVDWKIEEFHSDSKVLSQILWVSDLMRNDDCKMIKNRLRCA